MQFILCLEMKNWKFLHVINFPEFRYRYKNAKINSSEYICSVL